MSSCSEVQHSGPRIYTYVVALCVYTVYFIPTLHILYRYYTTLQCTGIYYYNNTMLYARVYLLIYIYDYNNITALLFARARVKAQRTINSQQLHKYNIGAQTFYASDLRFIGKYTSRRCLYIYIRTTATAARFIDLFCLGARDREQKSHGFRTRCSFDLKRIGTRFPDF